ncbi:MAG TPA: hypothetical protein VIK86_02810 [Candidatus Paceibacterota bacterium]
MDKNYVYKILDINGEDDKEQIASKFGLFRLEWLKGKKIFSEKEMDKIGILVSDILENDITDERGYAIKMEDLRKDLKNNKS